MNRLTRRSVGLLAVVLAATAFGTAVAYADPTPRPPVPAPAPAPGPVPNPPPGVAPNPTPPPPAPQPNPEPAPIPQPAPTPPAAPGDGGPGLFDIAGRVRAAINGWFHSLVVDALNPFLSLVGRTVMATPDVTTSGQVRSMWLISAGIANAAFVLLVLIGGMVSMGYETVQTRYAVKDLLPRIVVGWVGANASLELAHLAISAANGLSQAFLGAGVDPERAADGLLQMALVALTGGPIRALLGLGLVVLAIALLGVHVVRIATVVVLVAAAPLCLSAHVLPTTNGAARLWWRALAGCLGIQVAQSFVLITATRVFFTAAGRGPLGLVTGGLMDLVVLGALLWLLLKIPSYAGRLVFSNNGNVGLRMVKTVIVSRALGAGSRGIR